MTKKRFLAPILIAASAFLAACSSDTIIARPIWADEKIVEDVEKDNKLKEIYDAIKKLSDTNPAILNNILSKIAEQQFGSISFGANPAQGKEGIETYRKTESFGPAFDKFVTDHPVYAAPNKGVKMSGGKAVEVTLTEADKREISRNKIERRYNEVVENIYEKLFNEINSGNYSFEGEYFEERFIRYIRGELYDTPTIDEITTAAIPLRRNVVFTPRKYEGGKTQSWESYVNVNATGNIGFINVIDDTTGQYVAANNKPIYKDYIERKIIPEIYRNFLTQSYAKEQNYGSMGRTYARKVHMITIHKNDNGSVPSLLEAYADKYITGTNPTGGDANFSILENAMRGYVTQGSAEEALLKAAGFKTYTIQGGMTQAKWIMPDGSTTYNVYRGTKLADVVETYNKIYDFESGTSTIGANFKPVLKKNPDADAYKDLTGSGAHLIEDGLKLKYREIDNTTYTKDGWYLKSEGVTDVGNEVKNRLFNFDVSDIIDNPTEDYKPSDSVRYFDIGSDKQAYLTTSESVKTPAELVSIADGDNFHIIRVEEAISTSKLADVENKGSYVYKKCVSETDATDSTKKMDDIVFEVVKKVASGDEYKTNAEQYYLMVSNIIFYDQDLYDYFKSQYPDIFK